MSWAEEGFPDLGIERGGISVADGRMRPSLREWWLGVLRGF
jgi:hypothetical protein